MLYEKLLPEKQLQFSKIFDKKSLNNIYIDGENLNQIRQLFERSPI